MDTQGQIGVFLLYVALGFAVGFLYEPFAFLRLFFGCNKGRRAVFGGVLDAVFWCGACLLVNVAVFYGRLPSFRLYMWIGFLLGGIIYCKTLRRILAIFQKLCYNICKKVLKRKKREEKSLERE